jgi:hypothetical protein
MPRNFLSTQYAASEAFRLLKAPCVAARSVLAYSPVIAKVGHVPTPLKRGAFTVSSRRGVADSIPRPLRLERTCFRPTGLLRLGERGQ